jgi:hypothetical protein
MSVLRKLWFSLRSKIWSFPSGTDAKMQSETRKFRISFLMMMFWGDFSSLAMRKIERRHVLFCEEKFARSRFSDILTEFISYADGDWQLCTPPMHFRTKNKAVIRTFLFLFVALFLISATQNLLLLGMV